MPTSADSVYFDANSVKAAGQTITLNTTGSCLSIVLTNVANNPTFSLGSQTLNVYNAATFTGTYVLNAGTSTINFHYFGSSGAKIFAGNGKTYYNVSFKAIGYKITGDNTFNDINFSAGAQLVFTAGSTQTFATLSGDGTNGTSGLVSLLSDTAGAHYHLVSGGTQVDRVYWSIKDCYASGGTFNATYSFDLGGNDGWNITAIPATRYWVGGTGTWDTTTSTHWSVTSGGTAGAPVPTALDDVYFNANSFTTGGLQLTFNNGSIYCKDLDFTGLANNPLIRYYNETGDLYIAGNATYNINYTYVDPTKYSDYRIHMTGNNKTFNGAGCTFPTVCIEGANTTIVGNNTFMDLNFEGVTKTINITADSTQTTNRLGVLGTVSAPITIQSTSAGSHYHISCPLMATFNYCSIQDCTGLGGATFTAYNSTNVSGNTGITFLAGNPDLTSGLHYVQNNPTNINVFNPNCFSTVKGGSGAKRLSSSSTTNIYFDQGTLLADMATMNTNNASVLSCNDFDIAHMNIHMNQLQLIGGNDIYIYGNFYGNYATGGINCTNHTYALVFKATSTKTITTGVTLLTSVKFDGVGGKWILQDIFYCKSGSVSGRMTITNGEVDVNGYSLLIKVGLTLAAGATLTLGSGNFIMEGGNLSFANNPTFNCGTGTMMFSGASQTLTGNGYTFYRVVCECITGLTIVGNNTFYELYINAGRTCKITSGSIQTISSLAGTGVSGNLSILTSVTAGAHYHLVSTSAEVEANWYSIKDCYASGGATFYAFDSTNVSGNDGWTWGTNRYWVGNSGNWTDNFWSLTSGGAAGASVPTSETNVYFNANSFNGVGQTIALVGDVSCRSLNFTGVANYPTLLMFGATSFTISGSVTLVSGMTVDNTGYLTGYWNLASKIKWKTITTAGNTLTNMLFTANDGEYTLQDNLTLIGEFYNFFGDVNLNGKLLYCTDFTFHDSSGARTLTMGASTINVSGNFTMETDEHLTLNANTSTIVMSGDNKTFSGDDHTYNIVEFQGAPNIIVGDNTFNELILDADSVIQFTAGSTQTITTLTTNATGGATITMESTSQGDQWNLIQASGNATVSYCSIEDSNASGGATFLAMSSEDVNNNDGWTFFNIPPCIATSVFRKPAISVYTSGGGGGGSGSEEEEEGGVVTVNIHPTMMYSSCLFLNPEIVILAVGEVRIYQVLGNASCEFPIPILALHKDIQVNLGNSIANFLIPRMFENAQITAPLANSNAEFLLPIVYDGHNIDLTVKTAIATSEFLEPSIEIFFHYESVNFLLDVKGNAYSLFISPLILV